MILVIVLAMCIALLLNKRPLLTPLYVTILFVPWVLSEVVSGTMWRWLFNQDYGIVQVALNPLINDTSLLANTIGAMAIVILSSVWRSLPFTTLLFLRRLADRFNRNQRSCIAGWGFSLAVILAYHHPNHKPYPAGGHLAKFHRRHQPVRFNPCHYWRWSWNSHQHNFGLALPRGLQIW